MIFPPTCMGGGKAVENLTSTVRSKGRPKQTNKKYPSAVNLAYQDTCVGEEDETFEISNLISREHDHPVSKICLQDYRIRMELLPQVSQI